ncbi:unnamed protein product, partial [Meganyctiphanes norvegica]
RPLSQVQGAVDHWELNTCIQFKEVPPDYPKTFVRVVKGYGCSSNSVGRLRKDNRGHQQLSIGVGCGTAEAIHEMGHVLGFEHEHGRSDRNTYITMYSRSYNGWTPEQTQHHTRNQVPYDFTSVMHRYPAIPSTCVTGKSKILMPHNPYNIRLISHRKVLSWRDIKAANLAYKCIDKWRAHHPHSRACYNEGYTGKDGKCNCPPGTRGETCQIKYADYYPPLTCGGNVTEATTIQPNSSYRQERCMWWIQAPDCNK